MFNIPQQPAGVSGFGNNFSAGNLNFGSGLQENYSDFGLPSNDDVQSGAMVVQIRKLYLGETRPQSNQYRRNYNSFLDGTSFNTLSEEVARNPSSVMNPIDLANIFSKTAPIVSYSATAERQVDVVNGWETPRYRFTMVVDVYRNKRYISTEFVSGYTDYQGVNNPQMENSFSIDPELVFHINQVTEASSRQSDAMGNPVPMVAASSQVITNTSYTGIASPTQMIGMRPQDVIKAVGKLDWYRGFDAATDLGVGVIGMRDLDVTMGAMPIMSTADNALAPTFASRMISQLHLASLKPQDVANMDGVNQTKIAQERLKEASFTSRSFIHVMQRRLNNGVGSTGSFTMSDLLQLDPTIDDRAVIFGQTFNDGSSGIMIPDGSGVSNIGAVSQCAVAATCVANTIIQLMSKSGVTVMGLHLDNFTGVDDGVVQAAAGMDYDGQLYQRLEMIKTRMIIEAIPLIKPDPESVYDITILADAFNDVFVEVSINGQHDQFLLPAFASSTFSPIVTNDMGNLTGMAENINTLVGVINNTVSDKTGLVDQHGNLFEGVTSGHNYGSGGNF